MKLLFNFIDDGSVVLNLVSEALFFTIFEFIFFFALKVLSIICIIFYSSVDKKYLGISMRLALNNIFQCSVLPPIKKRLN